MKVREKYLPNEIGEKINGFFTFSEKNTQRLVLANKKSGIKVKNSRTRPRIQKEEKSVNANLTFSAAFPFETLADFQIALDQKAKKEVMSQRF